jgi:hypothetical protein
MAVILAALPVVVASARIQASPVRDNRSGCEYPLHNGNGGTQESSSNGMKNPTLHGVLLELFLFVRHPTATPAVWW